MPYHLLTLNRRMEHCNTQCSSMRPLVYYQTKALIIDRNEILSRHQEHFKYNGYRQSHGAFFQGPMLHDAAVIGRKHGSRSERYSLLVIGYDPYYRHPATNARDASETCRVAHLEIDLVNSACEGR